MMARSGWEGEELFGGGDNQATRKDDEMMMKDTPQSLGKRQGTDEMTKNAALPSLDEQGESDAMMTKAISPSLGK
jgi:hypothetical protein